MSQIQHDPWHLMNSSGFGLMYMYALQDIIIQTAEPVW